MKIILSRKGFDSEFGRCPSPILPDGRMVSLPIPSEIDSIYYRDLKLDDKTYYDLMNDLGVAKDILDKPCHLDPDIRREIIDRMENWKPLFGQMGSAQGHLNNQGIKEGDLFLFFGTFRKAFLYKGKYKFEPNEKEKHVIFGYLQIGKIIRVKEEIEDWMEKHPHSNSWRWLKNNNALYVAKSTFTLNPKISGAGVFNYDENLVLTAKNQPLKSFWHLPILKGKKVSYHHGNSWKDDFFKSAGRGQEFVIEENSEIESWAKELIEKGVKQIEK